MDAFGRRDTDHLPFFTHGTDAWIYTGESFKPLQVYFGRLFSFYYIIDARFFCNPSRKGIL